MSVLKFKCTKATMTVMTPQMLNSDDPAAQTDKVLGAHCRFGGLVDGSVMKDLFGMDHVPDYLWAKGGDNDPVFHGLKNPFASETDFERHEVKFSGLHLKNVKVHNVKAELRQHGQVYLEWTVSVKNPTEKQYWEISQKIGSSMQVAVSASADLLADIKEAEAEE